MGIADAMRAELERMRELDREQERLITELIQRTQKLIDDSNIERAKFDALDD